MRIIEKCRYGVHGIPAFGLGAGTNLPRFNMQLEMGLYLGCKRYGGKSQRRKACLVLESDPYRYRASISDISGQDIHPHGGKAERAIVKVRNWLASVSRPRPLPGGSEVVERYGRFVEYAPRLYKKLKLRQDELPFGNR